MNTHNYMIEPSQKGIQVQVLTFMIDDFKRRGRGRRSNTVKQQMGIGLQLQSETF